jgi:hypothetical protein
LFPRNYGGQKATVGNNIDKAETTDAGKLCPGVIFHFLFPSKAQKSLLSFYVGYAKKVETYSF